MGTLSKWYIFAGTYYKKNLCVHKICGSRLQFIFKSPSSIDNIRYMTKCTRVSHRLNNCVEVVSDEAYYPPQWAQINGQEDFGHFLFMIKIPLQNTTVEAN